MGKIALGVLSVGAGVGAFYVVVDAVVGGLHYLAAALTVVPH